VEGHLIEPTDAAPVESKEDKHVAHTLLEVSDMRGFRATVRVPGVTLKREQLVARVREKALREYPPDALRREGTQLQMLGFAPLAFDYLNEMEKLLSAQLEGFYEPRNGTMYLAADLEGAQADATLAHELVHALQDQRWDLKKRSEYRPGHGDETMALACLAEGDATSLMLGYVLKPSRSALDLPAENIRELMRSGMDTGKVESVPHILRSTLVAPYIEGTSFVLSLRRTGGWAQVDQAWAQPPTTTEQILHREKWDAREPALEVAAPTARALGEGWKREDEDTFGELGFALTFGEWMSENEARSIAAGWGGDRTAAFVKGDEVAYAAHLRFDGGPESARAIRKITPALKQRLGKAAKESASFVCFERKDLGPLSFAQKDRDVVMLVGPSKHSDGSFRSAGNCERAKAWSDEVAAQQ
jgi:hypothetical protein